MNNIPESLKTQLSRSSMRILIVEDNEVYRWMLHDYLSYCGYQVQCLANGDRWSTVLAEFQPDLILLDLKLHSDIDGYTLLAQLQQATNWRHIPVIVVSAYAFKADVQRALNLGAREYLVKPISCSGLSQAIQNQLRNSLVENESSLPTFIPSAVG